MDFKRASADVVSRIIAPLPRIKGLGIPLSKIARLFSSSDVVLTRTVFGSKMKLRANDLIGNMLLFTPNYYDRKERNFVSDHVRPGDYVVDVGANIGVYTLMLAKLTGERGSVTAIEAEPLNASRLRENLALNSVQNVDIQNFGVSDKKEKLTLMLNLTGNAGGHSFYSQNNGDELRTIDIQCYPLLDLLLSDRRPKFMKLDIEGFEYRVLKTYFSSARNELLPEFIMLEDDPDRRESDAVALCLENRYEVINRFDNNVMLKNAVYHR